jgi:hypothetical protein
MDEVSGSIWGSKPITATCACCMRKFHTTEVYKQQVISGRIVSLCNECEGDVDIDDHDYPPEIENEDEERRHSI